MAVKFYQLLQILLTCFSVQPKPDKNDGLFTSSTDLQSLVVTEAELVKILDDYILKETTRLNKIKHLFQKFVMIKDRAAEDNLFVGNPLNSFQLIKSLTSDWKIVKNYLNSNAEDKLYEKLKSVKVQKRLLWPSEEDLNGAAVGLIRLQYTYHLDTESLSRGVLNGHQYETTLSAHDCFELGRQAYNVHNYFHTNLWMDQALKVYQEESDKSVAQSDILEYLAFASYMSGNIRRALKLTNQMLDMEPDHSRGWGNKQYYEDMLEKKGASYIKKGEDGLGDADEAVNVLKERRKREDELGEERVHYEQLCRGEEFITEHQRSQLICTYNFGKHNFLKIGPLKEEEVFLKPRIVLFHDFLTSGEISRIKASATPKLSRSAVFKNNVGGLKSAKMR